MAILTNEALDRWMYRKSGMDYGPFTTREIEHMIESAEITAETEVLNRRTKHWARVREMPVLREYLEEKTRGEAEARRHAEIASDHSLVRRGNRRTLHLPLMAGGGAVLAGAVVAFLLLRAPPPVLAGYPTNFYKDLRFEPLTALKEMIAEPVKVQAVAAQPRAARAARPRPGSPTPGEAGSVDMAPQLDLSFDAADTGGGRVLAAEDLDGIQRSVAPRLVRCFRSEAERDPSFRGGSVFVYILPRGKAQVSRIQTDPAPSPALVSCAKSAAASVSVPPFSGAAQVMEIPLHVAGVL